MSGTIEDLGKNGSARLPFGDSLVSMSRAAPPSNPGETKTAIALLRWYVEMGADEAIGAEPVDRFAPPRLREEPPATIAVSRLPTPRAVAAAPPAALAESLGEAAQSARRLAASTDTVEALAAAVAGFDGCALKRTATNTQLAWVRSKGSSNG